MKVADGFMLWELNRGCEDFQAKVLSDKLRIYEWSLTPTKSFLKEEAFQEEN